VCAPVADLAVQGSARRRGRSAKSARVKTGRQLAETPPWARARKEEAHAHGRRKSSEEKSSGGADRGIRCGRSACPRALVGCRTKEETLLPASRCLAAALSASLLSLVLGSPASGATPSSMLAGETLAGSAATPNGLPTACSLGRNKTHFTFTGTASGAYAGTFTETGQITYRLSPNSFLPFFEDGVVTHFSGQFTIHSSTGFVRGSQTLDQTLSKGMVCDESPGGTSVSTETCQTSFSGEQCSTTPVPTRYVAHATNGTRVHVDKGTSMVFLDSTAESGVPLNHHSSIRVSISAKRDARRLPRTARCGRQVPFRAAPSQCARKQSPSRRR
jgi:hypothetical protein